MKIIGSIILSLVFVLNSFGQFVSGTVKTASGTPIRLVPIHVVGVTDPNENLTAYTGSMGTFYQSGLIGSNYYSIYPELVKGICGYAPGAITTFGNDPVIQDLQFVAIPCQ